MRRLPAAAEQFPGVSALTLKSSLWAHYRRVQRTLGERTLITCPSFVMPAEVTAWAAAIAAAPASLWIVKPTHASRARIRLVGGPPAQPASDRRRGLGGRRADPVAITRGGSRGGRRAAGVAHAWHGPI